jgi:integrase
MTRLEMAQLQRTAHRCFRDFLIAMRETIARPQEIRGLRWEFIQVASNQRTVLQALPLGEAFIVLDDYKGKERRRDPSKPRIILISKRLGRLLSRLASKCPKLKGFVFVNSKSKPWTSNAVRLRMKYLRDKTGLGNDFRGEPIVAYTFRHTQATEAAARGIRDRVLAEIMGHTSTRTTARYQHLETEHLREAIDKLTSRKKPEAK